ncbi:MAG: DNA-processing protein DprA [Candidatus Latescibacteria bacterium]|nr:DNA-processing protein DprA [Candidatus Latescibacterota bacterium]
MSPIELSPSDARYPSCLTERLGRDAPARLFASGNLDLLALPKIALFCSTRCPGSVLLAAYDQATRWRDEGRCIISGFHSPVEKECLRILLRGKQPIVICSARSLEGMRLPAAWKSPLVEGRLLLLSRFSSKHRRVTAQLASKRNHFVAALATEVFVVYSTPGSKIENTCRSALNLGQPTAVPGPCPA